jgi:hypothetical protein
MHTVIPFSSLPRPLTADEEMGRHDPNPKRHHVPAASDLKPGPASVRHVWPADRNHHPLPPRFFSR